MLELESNASAILHMPVHSKNVALCDLYVFIFNFNKSNLGLCYFAWVAQTHLEKCLLHLGQRSCPSLGGGWWVSREQ